MSKSSEQPRSCSYVVLLSGTHVTGKETLAVSLSTSLNSPWLKAEMIYNSARFGARTQAKKGYDYGEVFGRIWLSKLRRLGFLSDGNESDGESEAGIPTLRRLSIAPRKFEGECTAIISCYATRKEDRDAIRIVMMGIMIKPIFVIMHITKETLSGRTLGAEEPELEEKIMGEKIADIKEPLEEEKDVILIDSMREVDALFLDIKDGINRQIANL
ncbi:hypothetical protein LSUE1_G007034 [Lachnellula suecica]|uniref:Uncharacterized protein n=1 Tax=Lachnellula suecica TaxID=602035 RepID=A0A8T9C6U7_9HELO|nr:hypothetical protein LSUE1_G007034 [Lachnellula suecica]